MTLFFCKTFYIYIPWYTSWCRLRNWRYSKVYTTFVWTNFLAYLHNTVTALTGVHVRKCPSLCYTFISEIHAKISGGKKLTCVSRCYIWVYGPKTHRYSSAWSLSDWGQYKIPIPYFDANFNAFSLKFKAQMKGTCFCVQFKIYVNQMWFAIVREVFLQSSGGDPSLTTRPQEDIVRPSNGHSTWTVHNLQYKVSSI